MHKPYFATQNKNRDSAHILGPDRKARTKLWLYLAGMIVCPVLCILWITFDASFNFHIDPRRTPVDVLSVIACSFVIYRGHLFISEARFK